MDDGFDIKREGHTGTYRGAKVFLEIHDNESGLEWFRSHGWFTEAGPASGMGWWMELLSDEIFLLLFTEQVMRHAMMLWRLLVEGGENRRGLSYRSHCGCPSF